jgi:hypothetical protein
MLEWLKAAWAKWRIHITVVGGALVIATAYGTCTYEPATDEVSSTTPNATETVQVNSTTTDNQNSDNTTTTTENIETNSNTESNSTTESNNQ